MQAEHLIWFVPLRHTLIVSSQCYFILVFVHIQWEEDGKHHEPVLFLKSQSSLHKHSSCEVLILCPT